MNPPPPISSACHCWLDGTVSSLPLPGVNRSPPAPAYSSVAEELDEPAWPVRPRLARPTDDWLVILLDSLSCPPCAEFELPEFKKTTTPTPTSTASTTVAPITMAAVARDRSLPRRPGPRIPPIAMTITCYRAVRPAISGNRSNHDICRHPAGPDVYAESRIRVIRVTVR